MSNGADVVRGDYMPGLTWLRGIAALFVIVSHTLRATEVPYGYGDEPSRSMILSLFDLGAFGVACFFSLSGCTLYLSNAAKLHRAELSRFYLKRVLRIWPAYLVSLVAYVGFGVLFRDVYGPPRGAWVEQQFEASSRVVDLVNYVFLSFNVFGPAGRFNNAYWSLPVEFQYYLLFPFIVWLMRRFGMWGPVLLGAFAQVLYDLGIPSFFESRIVLKLAFTFCGGCLVGHFVSMTCFRLSGRLSVLLFSVCVLLASLVTNASDGFMTHSPLPEKWLLLGALSVLSVAVVAFADLRLPPPVAAFWGRLGTVSYGLYLYHNLFIAMSVLLLIKLGITSGSAKLVLVLALTMPLTYFVAKISYYYVEYPFTLFARRFKKEGVGLGGHGDGGC